MSIVHVAIVFDGRVPALRAMLVRVILVHRSSSRGLRASHLLDYMQLQGVGNIAILGAMEQSLLPCRSQVTATSRPWIIGETLLSRPMSNSVFNVLYEVLERTPGLSASDLAEKLVVAIFDPHASDPEVIRLVVKCEEVLDAELPEDVSDAQIIEIWKSATTTRVIEAVADWANRKFP